MPYTLNPFTGNLDYYESAAAGSGDVVGPSSSVDNAIVRFDGTTGKLIQDYTSGAPTIGDTGAVGIGIAPTAASKLAVSGSIASLPVVVVQPTDTLLTGGVFQVNNSAGAKVLQVWENPRSEIVLFGQSAGVAAGMAYYDGPDVANAGYALFGIDTGNNFSGVAGVSLASGKNGTGTLQPFNFLMGGNAVITIATTGKITVKNDLLFTDNTYDIGASGATRPKDYYGAGNILTGLGIKAQGPTNGVGYATGAGGTVTQATSKSTGVTINKVTGQITTHNATLNAGAEVGFTVTNSTIATTDTIIVNIASGGTADSYHIQVDAVAAGSFRISLTNVSGSNQGEALVLNFAVIKGVTS